MEDMYENPSNRYNKLFDQYGYGEHDIGENTLIEIEEGVIYFWKTHTHDSGLTEYNQHRFDGPAVIWNDGVGDMWYINGFDVDNKIYKWAKAQNIDLNDLSDEDKVLIKLAWADYNG